MVHRWALAPDGPGGHPRSGGFDAHELPTFHVATEPASEGPVAPGVRIFMRSDAFFSFGLNRECRAGSTLLSFG